MNFYPHHIGDYLTATAHLTWLEDCAYRRLLDVYYSREQTIPGDIAQACRLVRASSKDERKAVETVLREFFTLAEGWAHSRCDEEIIKAREAADRARINGRMGGRPRKEKPTANPEITQGFPAANPEKSNSQAPNPNPITNSSVSKDTDGDAVAVDLTKAELWAAGKSLLESQGMPKAQCGSFVGKLVKDFGDAVVVEAVRSAVVKRSPDAAGYLVAACQHAAGQRKHAEPEWRSEQRERTQLAAPGVAAGQAAADFFIDVEARNVTPNALA